MKKLLCVMLSIMLLVTAVSAFAESEPEAEAPAEEAAAVEASSEEPAAEAEAPAEEPAAEAETEAQAETPEVVELLTVNGKPINSDDFGYQAYLTYYMNSLAQYGLDESVEEYKYYYAIYRNASLAAAVQHAFYMEKAAELNLTPSEEERASYEQNVRDYWQNAIESYIADSGITEESTAEEREAAIAEALTVFRDDYGYTEDSYVAESMGEYDYFIYQDLAQAELTKDLAVTDEEIQDYFNELVEEDKSQYEGNIYSYELSQYQGQESYYVPEGYRGITHILLKVDEELMNNWKDLTARYEEQESGQEEPTEETAEPAEDAGAAGESAEAEAAEPTDTPEPTAEPVTQEMVDAAKQAILDSVQATVDEIKARLDAGESFEDLIKEYGTDPGMEDDATRAEGYKVHKDSVMWDSAFTSGAMALENLGDVSDPVVGQYGVHILHYLRDVPAGAVELTDEIREALRADLQEESNNQYMTDLYEAWKAASDIQYTAEGQAILDAADEANAYLNGGNETGSTEEEASETADAPEAEEGTGAEAPAKEEAPAAEEAPAEEPAEESTEGSEAP